MAEETQLDENQGAIPLPAAPIATEWEPYLRASRPTDDNPIVFTQRQVERMHWITAVVSDVNSPDRAAALDQLTNVLGYLSARLMESSYGEGSTLPTSAQAWARLDAQPYFLAGSRHEAHLKDLRRKGLDPYGQPLPTEPE